MKSKKSIYFILISAVIILGVSLFLFFNKDKKGNVRYTKIDLGKLSIYTLEERQEAASVILEKFKNDFHATLKELWYANPIGVADTYAKRYQADEAIIFYSNFKTYKKEYIESGIGPNQEIKNWMWVLTRINKGPWELKTWGYR